MIQLQNVSKSYKRGNSPVTVLHDISLKINRNEFVAIMGPSGSGKSTLLKILGCLDTADSGSYLCKGEPIITAGEDDLAAIRNRSLGFIFQCFNFIPNINAQRNIGNGNSVEIFDRNRLYGAFGYMIQKGIKIQFGVMSQTTNNWNKKQLQFSFHHNF